MTLNRRTLLPALAICIASTALAAQTPYDFTGHWTGSASSRGVTAAATADLTSPALDAFTGVVTLAPGTADQLMCTVEGTRHNKKVRVHSTCDNGTMRTVTLHFSATRRTISGGFSSVGGHGKIRHFRITLTQA